MTETLVLILAAGIPFFSWQQREEGRNVVSSLIAGLFVLLCLVMDKIPIVMDTTTISVFCFAGWMIVSNSWSNSRQSNKDLYSLLTGLILFLAARTVDMEFILYCLSAAGLVFACAVLYYRNNGNLKKRWFIFGNNNHIAAFLLLPFFSSFYLIETSLMFIIPAFLIAVAIGISHSRAGQLALIAGMLFIAAQSPYGMIAIAVVAAMVLLRLKTRGLSLRGSFVHRIALVIAAFHIIKKSPMFGFGLRTFRREYPVVMPTLQKNKTFKKLDRLNVNAHKMGPRDEITLTSHRVHNDHLELVLELGIIGYILFVFIFANLNWASPILSAGIVAFAVNALFFFPLRESHTSLGLFAFMGCMAGVGSQSMSLTPFIEIVLGLIIVRILYGISVSLLGLCYYHSAAMIQVPPNANDKMLAKKQEFLNLAINCEPYNNIYLTEGYYYNVFNNPEVAFQYASRCLENYDGGKVRWGIADQYARALLNLGGFGAAKMAVKHALSLYPEFEQSISLSKQIAELEGGANG